MLNCITNIIIIIFFYCHTWQFSGFVSGSRLWDHLQHPMVIYMLLEIKPGLTTFKANGILLTLLFLLSNYSEYWINFYILTNYAGKTVIFEYFILYYFNNSGFDLCQKGFQIVSQSIIYCNMYTFFEIVSFKF